MPSQHRVVYEGRPRRGRGSLAALALPPWAWAAQALALWIAGSSLRAPARRATSTGRR